MAINQLDNSAVDENIEFISKRGNKDVGQVDKNLLIKTLRKAIPIQCAIIFKTTIILSLLFWIVGYVLQN